MTAEGKLLKLSSLAALFVGIATLVTGIVFAVANTIDMDAWATAAEGLGATVYGVRTAILANVPSNTSKIRMKAAILLVAALAVVAYFLYAKGAVQVVQICLAVAICLIALYALVLAHRIVRAQLRA